MPPADGIQRALAQERSRGVAKPVALFKGWYARIRLPRSWSTTSGPSGACGRQRLLYFLTVRVHDGRGTEPSATTSQMASARPMSRGHRHVRRYQPSLYIMSRGVLLQQRNEAFDAIQAADAKCYLLQCRQRTKTLTETPGAFLSGTSTTSYATRDSTIKDEDNNG